MTPTKINKCSCGRTISANKVACGACLEKTAKQYAATEEPFTGVLEILNIGHGDMKLTFSPEDPAETIRAGRVIEDMLRRGYALIAEVERDGKRAYERVQRFDPTTREYVIADMDPLAAREADMEEAADNLRKQQDAHTAAYEYHQAIAPPALADKDIPIEPVCGVKVSGLGPCTLPKGHKGRHKREKRLPMERTKATAIGRSAGGD